MRIRYNVIILPASPCAAEFYEIWHTRSSHRRNHVCQIFSRSVQGLRSSDTPKLPFPFDLLRRPYNSVALPCDTVMDVFTPCIKDYMSSFNNSRGTVEFKFVLSTVPVKIICVVLYI